MQILKYKDYKCKVRFLFFFTSSFNNVAYQQNNFEF